ncbi:oligosaccharide flippase family protein [Providencia rettgeri]|uniref:oligosaccharide flippase family protein n=1 Tax=Providencia rettgeri TaxID=587 RepID=UPI0018E45BEA|nr:oligosaccharide flippase family protein [Providencia rettgeri]MBI6191591.1 oligosaccharide flippase family protein [Providencia rettgeri]
MSLIKTSSIYLLSNLLNAIIPFLLLPILTRNLTTAEYGQIAIFQMLLTGVTAIIGLNSSAAANRKFYDENETTSSLREYNGSSLQIIIFSSLITFFLTFIFSNELSYFLTIPISWIYYSVIISSFTYVCTFRLGQWQIRSKAKHYGLLQVTSSTVNMLLSLYLVISLREGASGRVNAQLITSIIFAIIAITLLYKDNLIKLITFCPSKIKELLAYGLPLVPHNIGFFLIGSIDRFFINKEIGLSETGIYMVALQISLGLAIIFDAINKAYVPWLFGKLKENEYKEKVIIVKFTYLYCFSLLLIPLLGFILGPTLVIFIAGKNYAEAGNLIGWLCLGQTFGGMYLMVTNYLFYSKKTGKLASITIFTGIINVLLLIVLIHSLGLIGAAVAFSVSKLLQFIFTWLAALKCVDMPWFYFKKRA